MYLPTWISNSSFNSIASFKKQLDDPWRDEAAGAGDANDLAGAGRGRGVNGHDWEEWLVGGRFISKYDRRQESGSRMKKSWPEESCIYRGKSFTDSPNTVKCERGCTLTNDVRWWWCTGGGAGGWWRPGPHKVGLSPITYFL